MVQLLLAPVSFAFIKSRVKATGKINIIVAHKLINFFYLFSQNSSNLRGEMGWDGMGKTHSSQGEAGRGKFVSTYSSLFFHAFWINLKDDILVT